MRDSIRDNKLAVEKSFEEKVDGMKEELKGSSNKIILLEEKLKEAGNGENSENSFPVMKETIDRLRSDNWKLISQNTGFRESNSTLEQELKGLREGKTEDPDIKKLREELDQESK